MGFFGDIERFLAELYPYRWPIVVAGLALVAAAVVFAYRRGWHRAILRHRLAVAAVGTPLLVLAIVSGWYTGSPLFERTQLEEANPLVSVTDMPRSVQMLDEQLIGEKPAASPAPAPIDSTSQDTTEKLGNAADQDSTVAARPEPMPADSVTDDAMEKTGDAPISIDAGEVTDSTPANPAPSDSAQANITPPDMIPPGSTSADAAEVFTPGNTHNGEFRGTDEFHFARGQASLIETSPGQYVLRFEDFSVRNGPGLYVYLSPDADRYTGNSRQLGKLKATDGSFNYEIPAGTDISQFKSVVIWCKPFGVLFGVAPLIAQ